MARRRCAQAWGQPACPVQDPQHAWHAAPPGRAAQHSTPAWRQLSSAQPSPTRVAPLAQLLVAPHRVAHDAHGPRHAVAGTLHPANRRQPPTGQSAIHPATLFGKWLPSGCLPGDRWQLQQCYLSSGDVRRGRQTLSASQPSLSCACPPAHLNTRQLRVQRASGSAVHDLMSVSVALQTSRTQAPAGPAAVCTGGVARGCERNAGECTGCVIRVWLAAGPSTHTRMQTLVHKPSRGEGLACRGSSAPPTHRAAHPPMMKPAAGRVMRRRAPLQQAGGGGGQARRASASQGEGQARMLRGLQQVQAE